MTGKPDTRAHALSYIASDVPDGMRLVAWRKTAAMPRRKHHRVALGRLRRH
ncbi:MAG: hypothetical protein ACJ760_09300 [Thermoleophilaceae bacterium]